MSLTQTFDWTVPVSYCAVCDEGLSWQEIPDESCGCDLASRRTFRVPVVAVDELLSDETVERVQAALQRADGLIGPTAALAQALLREAVDPLTGKDSS